MNLPTRSAARESKVHQRDSRARTPDGLGQFKLLIDPIGALEAAVPGQPIDATVRQVLGRCAMKLKRGHRGASMRTT